MRSLRCLAVALCLLAPLTAAAQPAAPPCNSPEHRQFDFWLGKWQVHTPDGKLAGYNTITSEYGGCVLHERYTTEQGFSGESLNLYDASRGLWHQTWVDSTGQLLLLDGRLHKDGMLLEGTTRGADGELLVQRITWTPNRDGSVRQLWESMGKDGEWQVVFDGLYSKL
ncbi:hypothetical protein [Mangrovimicrobium sediminis]|uniref:hypothetical protein n=1 Tax=Mangrovimicrobium sediminis TaxID=2562682 RepID=UPI0019819E24|nr:hypothetical protein [Haliea sp. SAOS-164]